MIFYSHCHCKRMLDLEACFWYNNKILIPIFPWRSSCLLIAVPINHWLTPRKGVHLFRYFLPTMRTPNQLFSPHAYMHFSCFVVYALSARALNAYTKDLWCTHWLHHKTMEMQICMGRKELDRCTHCGKEIPKQVYTLSWCKPVKWFYYFIPLNWTTEHLGCGMGGYDRVKCKKIPFTTLQVNSHLV